MSDGMNPCFCHGNIDPECPKHGEAAQARYALMRQLSDPKFREAFMRQAATRLADPAYRAAFNAAPSAPAEVAVLGLPIQADAMSARLVIGKRIAAARAERGLTLRALGSKMSLSHVFISAIERGAARIPPDRRASFAEALGLNVRDVTELDAPTLIAVAEKFERQGNEMVGGRLRELARDGVL